MLCYIQAKSFCGFLCIPGLAKGDASAVVLLVLSILKGLGTLPVEIP